MLISLVLVAFVASLGSSSAVPSSVLQLSDKFLDVKEEGFWFIKLYAPWCAHCKRLAPVWEHVGHALADKNPLIRVAKIDCTLYPKACSKLEIHGYPTLLFFRNGQVIQYEGEREKESMVDFAIKCAAPSIAPIHTLVQYNEIKTSSSREPVFIRVVSATGADEEEAEGSLAYAYKSTSSELFSLTRFFSISAKIAPVYLKEGEVYVMRDGTTEAYTGEPSDLTQWAQSERLPLVARATATTLHHLGQADKLIVVIVSSLIDRLNASSEVGAFYTMAAGAARKARKDPELKRRFQFAWTDGGSVVSSIAMQAIEAPSLVVINYTTYEYYMPQDSATAMTEASLLLWLRGTVLNPDTEPEGGKSLYMRTRRMLYEIYTNVLHMFTTQPLLASFLFGVPIAFLSMITYSLCMSDFSVERDEIYPDEDDEMDEDDDDEDDGGRRNYAMEDDHAKAE